MYEILKKRNKLFLDCAYNAVYTEAAFKAAAERVGLHEPFHWRDYRALFSMHKKDIECESQEEVDRIMNAAVCSRNKDKAIILMLNEKIMLKDAEIDELREKLKDASR